ncbi:MAG TPA: sigma-70 family RNA polymerase sigma factor [Longimicrobium sp.]|nr:sigma-70 family RNA polymerase sigma factor [Longimicrobium sp.]
MSVDWGQIYHDTHRELVRFLYRKVWDAERAEDLVQEAFARALGHAPDNPRAWLFHVAANLARDEARMVIRRKKHLALLRTETELQEKSIRGPSAEVEERERIESLRQALEVLTERDREALLLWDAGLSYTEIAAQTGLAPGAVGTTLSRARQRLVDAHTAREGKHAARG